jgi:hypothetical protein
MTESIPGLHNVYKKGLRLQWLAKSIPWNRFLGSVKVLKTVSDTLGSSQIILQKINHKNKHISVHIIEQHEKSVDPVFLLSVFCG